MQPTNQISPTFSPQNQLLGFGVRQAEYITQGNYISYFFLMTMAWVLIDAVGRRRLLLGGSAALTTCFALLALFGALATRENNNNDNNTSGSPPIGAPAILGTISVFVATGAFGIGWLAPVWLIPTEIYATAARARAAAASVVVWGLANFAVTLASPLMFGGLGHRTFLVFAATNAAAGAWTYLYLPETGGRSFEDNRRFFEDARREGTWRVARVAGGAYRRLAYGGDLERENEPLLTRLRDQVDEL